VAGLRELDERSGLAVVVVEPEIGAEDLLVPVGALGADHDGISIGRQSNGWVADGIEELVERQFGLVVGKDQRRKTEECDQQ